MDLTETQQKYIEDIKSSIISGDGERINTLTDEVLPNIFLWDYDIFNDVLATFLNIVVNMGPKESRVTLFKNILKNFDDQESFIPIYSRIWFLARIREPTLIFMRNELPYSFSTYFVDLAVFETYPNDKPSVISIDQSVNRLFKIFGVPNTKDLIDLNQIIRSLIITGRYANGAAVSHIQNQLINASASELAPKPEYIEDFGYGYVDEAVDGTDKELDLEEALELLKTTPLLGPEGYEVSRKLALEIADDVIETRDERVMNMREFTYHNTIIRFPEDLYDILQNQDCNNIDPETVVKFEPDDIETRQSIAIYLFQIFGPINPYGDLEYGYDEQNPYNRMFNCVGYENALNDQRGEFDEDEELDTLSWFTGVCEYCNKQILYYWYAVRMPILPGGGFCGTYCSWDHVRKAAGPESLELLSYINEFERQCQEIGIHDR